MTVNSSQSDSTARHKAPRLLKRIGRTIRQCIQGTRVYTYLSLLRAYLELLRAYLEDCQRYVRNSSTIACRDERSLEGLIIRVYHALEVSLTYPQKEGQRGVQTAKRLVQVLDQQLMHYGCSCYSRRAYHVLHQFAENLKERHVNDPELAQAVSRLQSRFGDSKDSATQSGVRVLRRADVEHAASGNFDALVHSRYSVRTYAPDPVDDALIERAIAMALRCPTACNRQPARVYDLRSQEVRLKVLSIQNNGTAWRNEPDRLLLVTADVRLYQGERERSAAYIDGSLFAMTLVYALHSLGLGTCCLNLNLPPVSVCSLRRAIEASDAEVLIMLITAGVMKDEFAVPVSTRRDVAEVLCRV